MKSLLLLWQEAAEELAAWCHTSVAHDINTVVRRSNKEGTSFLTITLPAFAKDFEKSLEQKQVAHDSFSGFKRKGGLPLFLGGFLERVFDRETGSLLDSPEIDSIFAVRQLTLIFGKILIPCTPAREKGAIDGYIRCEQELRESDRRITDEMHMRFKTACAVLFGDVFDILNRDIETYALLPGHGPGATADRLSGNRKWDQREWPIRMQPYFPFGEFNLPNWRFEQRHVDAVFLEPGAERPVRVITVPKTLKTPRIIAVEPTVMQYGQQAISRRLCGLLEMSSLKVSPVAGMIGFVHSLPNQQLAQEGSITGGLATLDLSEASDRVSNQLVRSMFSPWPSLAGAVDATRSRKADVDGHGVIRLAKFASMGSALCFPVEAMAFLAIIFIAIGEELGEPVTRRLVSKYRRSVRVYGDDLIVPTDMVNSVIGKLEAFGFRVNSNKSFWNGKFRESCGGDFYDGEDVSVVRCRRVLPSSHSDVQEIVSMVEFRNLMYKRGMWKTAYWLDAKLLPLLKGHFPVAADTSPGLSRFSFLGVIPEKESKTLHRPMVRAWVVKSKSPESKVSGEGALLKWFLKRGDQPIFDRDHLTRQGRARVVDIKLRWVPVA